MNQTRIGSLVESMMNIAIGYFVALGSQLLIFPLFGIHVSLSTNLWIGLWFTVISLIRSYVIRRWFNARLHRAALRFSESVR
jgi:membrane protein implicated in regulation of membrane protease activity